MAQKKTAGAARPAAKKTETELTLVQPAVAESAAKRSPAAQTEAPAKETAVKQPAPASAKAPKAASAAVVAFAGYEDLAAAGQDAIDTYLICSKIAAEGVESLGKEVVDFARASVEAQFAFAKTLMDAKTLQDAIEAQSDYTTKNVDHLTAQAAKLTEMSVKLANQLMEPIQARASATAETWLKPVAA